MSPLRRAGAVLRSCALLPTLLTGSTLTRIAPITVFVWRVYGRGYIDPGIQRGIRSPPSTPIRYRPGIQREAPFVVVIAITVRSVRGTGTLDHISVHAAFFGGVVDGLAHARRVQQVEGFHHRRLRIGVGHRATILEERIHRPVVQPNLQIRDDVLFSDGPIGHHP